MKILITSGGTKVPIDLVRDITNMSQGTFGSRIAKEYLKLGHEVIFMKAKGSKDPFELKLDLADQPSDNIYKLQIAIDEMEKHAVRFTPYEYTTYEKYADMLPLVIGMEQPDLIVLSAAVSDYGVENFVSGKMRSNDMYTVKLCQLPKLISRVKEWAPKAKLIGFKLLVNSKLPELLAAAQRTLDDNKCDMVVANDLQEIKDNNHQIHLLTKNKNTTTYKSDLNDSDFLARMVVKHSFLI